MFRSAPYRCSWAQKGDKECLRMVLRKQDNWRSLGVYLHTLMSKREESSCLNEGVRGETIIYLGSGEKCVSGTAFPRREQCRLPEIHRLIVLQMLDLNSCVLNQDCGKQQQKLVYRALLRSDGNLWGGGASSVQAIFWALLHPEESP